MGRVRNHQLSRVDNHNGNSSAVHPMRMLEDETLDYDSNASSSSFEFHKGERSAHNPISRPFSRPIPYKWNDAEKWIMNRQTKKNSFHNQASRLMTTTGMVRVAPEYANHDYKASQVARTVETKQADSSQPALQTSFDKFSFVPSGTGQGCGGSALVNTCSQSKDLVELDRGELPCLTGLSEDKSGGNCNFIIIQFIYQLKFMEFVCFNCISVVSLLWETNQKGILNYGFML